MDTPFADSFTKAQLQGLLQWLVKPTHKERIEAFRYELHNMVENTPDESTRRILSAQMFAKFNSMGEKI